MKCIALIVALCATLVLIACGGDSSTDATQAALKSTIRPSKAKEDRPAPRQAASSSARVIAKRSEPTVRMSSVPPPKELVVENLIEGIGAVAEKGDELTVLYVAVNYRTGKEYENSWNLPFKFELGSGSVSAGWERGLGGMQVGGRRELIVPPRLAPFGDDTLVYVVDLLAVK